MSPYETSSARNAEPMGTMSPTGITIFSQRNGTRSLLASPDGTLPASTAIATAVPTTLASTKIAEVTLRRHLPMSTDRTVPYSTRASMSHHTPWPRAERTAVTKWSSRIVFLPR